jgi:hypothetical protein
MDTLTVAGALGILVPLAVGVLATVSTTSKIKGMIAVAICVAVGLVTAGTSGSLPGAFWGDVAEYVKYVGIVAISAQTAYEMFWKPVGATPALQANVGFTDE